MKRSNSVVDPPSQRQRVEDPNQTVHIQILKPLAPFAVGQPTEGVPSVHLLSPPQCVPPLAPKLATPVPLQMSTSTNLHVPAPPLTFSGALGPSRDEDHPHIHLATGKWYRFTDANTRYELRWSRWPELFREGDRAVDLERFNGVVQLLGALIECRIISPNKLQACDAYAKLVLKDANDTPYQTLVDVFDNLKRAFSDSAFKKLVGKGIAFNLRVEGPFSVGSEAAERSRKPNPSSQAIVRMPPLPPPVVMRPLRPAAPQPTLQGPPPGHLIFAPGVRLTPPTFPPLGMQGAPLVTSAQLLFATGQPAVGAAPFPASAPLAPLQPAGVPSPRTADSELVEWPAEYVDELRGLLLTAIQSADEETVLFCLRVRGVCDDEVLRQAKESAFGSGSIASGRIRAAVERVYGAGTSNTNTG